MGLLAGEDRYPLQGTTQLVPGDYHPPEPALRDDLPVIWEVPLEQSHEEHDLPMPEDGGVLVEDDIDFIVPELIAELLQLGQALPRQQVTIAQIDAPGKGAFYERK